MQCSPQSGVWLVLHVCPGTKVVVSSCVKLPLWFQRGMSLMSRQQKTMAAFHAGAVPAEVFRNELLGGWALSKLLFPCRPLSAEFW